MKRIAVLAIIAGLASGSAHAAGSPVAPTPSPAEAELDAAWNQVVADANAMPAHLQRLQNALSGAMNALKNENMRLKDQVAASAKAMMRPAAK
jgi:hypothetical protein